MSEYLDRQQVIELYEKYQPSLATHVYEFGEKLRALPMMALPVAELDTTEDFGEWKPYKDSDYCGGGYLMCTKCQYRFSFGAYCILQDDNYCPHCVVKIWKEV